jgi:hypothetical protein
MSFSITIPNLAPLLDALARYPQIAEPIIKRATDQALIDLVPDLAHYPPELPRQKYIRTGDLGEGWKDAQPQWQAIPSGFEGSIDNPMPYGPDVQGHLTQARIHSGRWKTDQQIVEAHALETEAIYDKALQEIADAIDAQAGNT